MEVIQIVSGHRARAHGMQRNDHRHVCGNDLLTLIIMCSLFMFNSACVLIFIIIIICCMNENKNKQKNK